MKRARLGLRWLIFILVVVGLFWSYQAFDLGRLLTLEHIKASRDAPPDSTLAQVI